MNVLASKAPRPVPHPLRRATDPKPAPAPAKTASKPKRRATDKTIPHQRVENRKVNEARVFLRGTNLLPPKDIKKPLPCVAGTKQSILIDQLRTPAGATMEELIAALSGGRKPWTEATVRSGFGWDLKRKGYGVRSEFDAKGVERFHLVVPKGQRIPAHSKAGKAPRGK